jgi:hypothetical protein
MKQFLMLLTAITAISFSAIAGTPKGEEKENSSNTEVKATPTESTLETKDFYVDNSGNRLNDEYPTLGDCDPPATENDNCHATYTRQSPSHPWVQQGAIVKGIKPF